jgi:hypothetical protein
MTHTFKLSRRTARFRAASVITLLALVGACNSPDLTEPTPTDAPSTAADPALDPSFAYTSSTAPGNLFGLSGPPTDQYAYTTKWTGALKQYVPSSWALNDLYTAKQYGARVVAGLAGGRSSYKNADGTFSMSKWKYNIDKWRSVSALTTYISSGTLMAHYLVDEPNWAGGWGGKAITRTQLQEMARYSKSIWPNLATTVRVRAGYLVGYSWPYLDFAWAQWEGPLHVPSYGMTPEQFRDREITDAKKAGVNLIFGLNYLDGGGGSSKIAGTYNLTYVKNRWQMSAAEIKRVGTVLAAASYGCGVVNWAWSKNYPAYSYLTSTQLYGIRNLLNRSDVKAANDSIAKVARNRTKVSCKKST